MDHYERVKKRRERLKAKGICVACGQRKAEPESTRCKFCNDKQKARDKSDNRARPRVDGNFLFA